MVQSLLTPGGKFPPAPNPIVEFGGTPFPHPELSLLPRLKLFSPCQKLLTVSSATRSFAPLLPFVFSFRIQFWISPWSSCSFNSQFFCRSLSLVRTAITHVRAHAAKMLGFGCTIRASVHHQMSPPSVQRLRFRSWCRVSWVDTLGGGSGGCRCGVVGGRLYV